MSIAPPHVFIVACLQLCNFNACYLMAHETNNNAWDSHDFNHVNGLYGDDYLDRFFELSEASPLSVLGIPSGNCSVSDVNQAFDNIAIKLRLDITIGEHSLARYKLRTYYLYAQLARYIACKQFYSTANLSTNQRAFHPSALRSILEPVLRQKLDCHGGTPIPLYECGVAHVDGCDCMRRGNRTEYVVCHACWLVIHQENANSHLRNHTDYCKICDDAVFNDVWEHMKQAHAQCIDCQNYENANDLLAHFWRTHPITCPSCHSSLSQVSLRVHLKRDHGLKGACFELMVLFGCL